jgi:Ser/Thr protein kinase RdoA (MazF antagonist)
MEKTRVILSSFAVERGNYTISQVTTGLINTSYKISDNTGKGKYFLQQIDHEVFRDVPGLMNNIVATINHLRKSQTVEQLELVTLKESEEYLYSSHGEYWRLYHFVEGKSYQRATLPVLAREAGHGFGMFLRAITDLDSQMLVETIPGFHDIFLRHEQFTSAKSQASHSRLAKADEQIHFADEQVVKMKDYYLHLVARAPQRVTHNDTKLSNLIFDDEDRARVVVDYDTLMPGYLPLDYGDAVRTICSTTVEDSTDLNSTRYEETLIREFTTAFAGNLKAELSSEEFSLLPMAACYMPFIMGLRMLTDYLNDDIYYSTSHIEHNLDRAKNQFKLYTSGMTMQEQIHNIVNNQSQKKNE